MLSDKLSVFTVRLFINSISKLLISILILMALSILVTYIQNFEAFDSYSGFLSKESQDIEIRVAMFSSAVELFLNNPVWGIGYGMFAGHNLTPVYNNDLVIYFHCNVKCIC